MHRFFFLVLSCAFFIFVFFFLNFFFVVVGMDGSYLCELLLEKGYIVYGLIRRSSSLNTERIEHILDKLRLRYGDVTDGSSIHLILTEIKNDNPEMSRLEIYNLAGMSHVKISFDMPIFTAQSTALGTLHMLEAVRICKLTDKCRFYQASSSEMFGSASPPQNENTRFHPRSPYAIAKCFAHRTTVNYREAYNMFACNGILFNHESPRRSFNFVTRKITRGVSMIIQKWHEQDLPVLVVGNLDARRDWGSAHEYVYAMWLMLQQPVADDYVISSQENHSVREFIELCFRKRNIEIKWQGEGLDEVGIDVFTQRVCVKVSEKFMRICEVDNLLGDSSKARNQLGWKPTMTFDDLVTEMLDYDCPQRVSV